MRVRVSGSGPPVLFLHGIPTGGCLWRPIVEHMSAQMRCMVVDLPYDFRDLGALAGSLEDVRRSHRVRQWHVVAHDAGCAIAAHYAHRFPTRVARLGLLSPSLFPELKPFYLFEPLRSPILGELLAPAVSSLFWRVAMPRAVAGGGAILEELRAPFRGWRGPWRLMNWLRWGDPAEVLAAMPDLLPRIAAPAAIFHGLQDPAVPAAFAHRAAMLLPNSQLTLLRAGHFLPLDEPALIANELLRFFGEAEQNAIRTVSDAVSSPSRRRRPGVTSRRAAGCSN
jgi:pimeloyl-ACP methyl ester carboxylesterase